MNATSLEDATENVSYSPEKKEALLEKIREFDKNL
jgi:hypothetical protein